MPNSISADKRVRQNESHRLLNKARKTELKSLDKQFQRAVHDGNKAEAETVSRTLTKRLDQAVGKNVVHKNYVSRHKAAIAKKLSGLA
ncbi:MAG: 30S ribosomal protein S20 [Planctomycetes bacterium]|nr:30S ribosomal protein S20 [Planctomycetota bacterium]